MKNLLTTILIFTFFSCKAQLTIYNIDTPPEQRTVTKNYYYKDINNHNDIFVGTWRWEEGNSSFELVLQEFEMYSEPISPTIYSDDIYGKYTYIVNGSTIADIETIDTFPNYKVAVSYRTPTTYSIVIKDIVSDRHKIGTLTLTPSDDPPVLGSPVIITMELHEPGGVKINYGNGQPWSLPNTLTLTKIE